MKQSWKSICLITINGKYSDNIIKFTGQYLPAKKTDYFTIKKVRNFITLDLSKLKIFVCAYSQGSFKLTLSRSINLKNIILNLEYVITKISEILQYFYRKKNNEENINVTAKISQIAITISPVDINNNKTKLSYQLLLKTVGLQNNKIIIDIADYQLIHPVNWLNYEDCGSSSFYFHIIPKNLISIENIISNETKTGGLKLFNNAKIIVFIHNIKKIKEIINIVEIFQEKIIKLFQMSTLYK